MLRLTKKIEYGLIALKHINCKSKDNIYNAKEIAECAQIPKELLAKVLQQLTRAEIIRSVQGPRGGYVLTCALHEISLAKFITVLEGEYGLVQCASETEDNCYLIDCCNIRSPLLRINQQLKTFLDNIYLDEILLTELELLVAVVKS